MGAESDDARAELRKPPGTDAPLHPLAVPGNRTGACGMKAGDRVRSTIDCRTGRADEFTTDGDTFVAWDDGSYGVVKWLILEPVQERP